MTETSKKVVVTGAKGFIGRRLVDALRKKGHEVVELDLPGIDISELYPDDPIYNKTLKGTDTIFHLAVMNLEHCKQDYRECIKANILGTASIMEIARKIGVRRVIYSSASSIYGDPITTPVSESHQQLPLTLYGATKLAAEKVIHSYSKNFDLTYGIFRFTNVYGVGQVNGLIPTVINNLLKDEKIQVTGTGEQTRDFIYVDDVVNALMQAMDHPEYSFICNLGSGCMFSVNEIIASLAGFTGKEAHINYVPLQIDREAFRADLKWYRELFGDRHKFTPIEDGLYKTVEWWKDHSTGCKYKSKCTLFDITSYTCITEPGSYCGKYREFSNETT
uniref:Putative NADH dehydrogenase n=1 Tax=viral metagenome TaxID=1070528 RepID=A0A6H1ZJB8_9ZZZZ